MRRDERANREKDSLPDIRTMRLNEDQPPSSGESEPQSLEQQQQHSYPHHHSLDNLTRSSSRRDNSPCNCNPNSAAASDFSERGRTSTPAFHSYHEPGGAAPQQRSASSSSKSQSSSRCTSLPTPRNTHVHMLNRSHYNRMHSATQQQQQQQLDTQQQQQQNNPHSLPMTNHPPQYASMPTMLYGVPSPHSLPPNHPPNSVYPSYNYPPGGDMNYHHRGQPMSLPQPLMYQYWSYPYVGQGTNPPPHSMPVQPPPSSLSQHGYKQPPPQRFRPEGGSDSQRKSGRSKQTRQASGSSHASSSSNSEFISPADKRYNIYKNLCGLFPKDVVESVMTSHPDITETKKLVKLCLGDS